MFIGNTLLFLSLAVPFTTASVFFLRDINIGHDFFEKWNFETIDDPTHGRTNYVDMQTAINNNLSFATEDKFFMQPDSTKVLQASDRGRDSIRISSKASYDESVIILDLQHMPFGCTTWPAFWSFSAVTPWPAGGEVDVIEGVNNQAQNLASLHTTPNCSMPANVTQTATVVSSNCDTTINFSQGCGNSLTKPGSYGKAFNDLGGGYYAVVRSPQDGIKIWFWSRQEKFIPIEVKKFLPVVTPSLWGIPDVDFPTGNQCNYADHFNAHNLLFDLTFCGDFAGAPSVWAAAGCGTGACVDYVNNNPTAFQDAYWEVNSLRVYTPFSD